MPTYLYKAINSRGRVSSGAMPAPDEATLEQKLKDSGLWLTESSIHVGDAGAAKAKRRDRRRYKLKGGKGRRELIDFCTLMAFQIRSGIPQLTALEVVRQDCKNEIFQEVIADLRKQIESGFSLNEAMMKYPGVFSVHFLSIVKAGEASSKLPEAFDDLREYLEWLERVIADLRQATTYPAIVLGVILLFMIFLFTFVIPVFSNLLTKLNIPQPLPTRIVFAIGAFAQSTWWIWIPLLLAPVLTVTVGKRYSPRIAYAIDVAKLRLPVFGELNLMLALSRFAHNLSILYRSGVPILSALELCQRGLIGNKVIEKAVGNIEAEVKVGNSIGDSMHKQPVFSALLVRMVAMGESSGNLDSALDNVSAYYSEIIPRRIKRVFSILEPAMMLFLIFMVGGVALAIYLPIISMMGAIH